MSCLLLTFFAMTQLAFAGTPAHKLVRGIEGIVTSPLEYLNQYNIASGKQSDVASVAVGIFGGTAMTLKRILNGAYDIVTFPVNSPKDYGLLLNDESETALQNHKQLQNAPS